MRRRNMILVDKDIKNRQSEIFCDGCYNASDVNPVSYDLHVMGIVEQDDLVDSYVLRPNEVIFVKMKEKIHIPKDLMGRIGEKNSRMRQGLWVTGPHYFPGHETYIYLRVQNITSGTIKIKKDDKIAQIFFEQLNGKPECAYDEQQSASYNEEDQYRGMAKYKDEYEERIGKIDNANNNLDEKINHIYANILTLMGIFVSVFSLIMVNFSNLGDQFANTKYVAVMNLSLGIVICLFLGLIMLFINHKEYSKKLLCIYGCIMAVLCVALLIILVI